MLANTNIEGKLADRAKWRKASKNCGLQVSKSQLSKFRFYQLNQGLE